MNRLTTWLFVIAGVAGLAVLSCDGGSFGGESGSGAGVLAEDVAGDSVYWWEEDEEDRGGQDNPQDPGWQDRGQDPGEAVVEETTDEEGKGLWDYYLHYTDIVLSPDGNNILVGVPKPGPDKGFETPGLVLAVQPLPSGAPHVMPQYQDVERVNFSPDGTTAYLLEAGGKSVSRLDLTTYAESASYALPGAFSVLDVTPDGQFLILSNLPRAGLTEKQIAADDESCEAPDVWGVPEGANLCKAAVVNVESGLVREVDLPNRLRDIDYDPLTSDVLLSYSKKAKGDPHPKSFMLFFQPATATWSCKLQFENCSDEVIVSPEALLALQGPTHCAFPAKFDPKKPLEQQFEEMQQEISAEVQVNYDPISVVDLEKREFVANLPGYGPVALSPDGMTAVGFTLRQPMKDQWDYEQKELVGLIFVDLDTLTWSVLDYGNEIPSYTYSPDGQYLYVYSDSPLTEGHIQRIDLGSLEKTELTGPTIDLDAFAWLPSGHEMYVLSDHGLYFISGSTAAIKKVEVPVTPDLIAIRPQEDLIVVAPSFKPVFFSLPVVANPQTLEVQQEFDLELSGAK